jgi:hypothetical protein
MTNLLEVFSRNSAAMDRYSLQASEQPVVLFAADNNEVPNHLREEWELCTGHGVDLRRVPGHHYTMLRKPYVSILAKLLGWLFDDVHNENHFALNERAELIAAPSAVGCYLGCSLLVVTSKNACLNGHIRVELRSRSIAGSRRTASSGMRQVSYSKLTEHRLFDEN